MGINGTPEQPLDLSYWILWHDWTKGAWGVLPDTLKGDELVVLLFIVHKPNTHIACKLCVWKW